MNLNKKNRNLTYNILNLNYIITKNFKNHYFTIKNYSKPYKKSIDSKIKENRFSIKKMIKQKNLVGVKKIN